MRLERLRAYTEASGPLYFGRIDRDGRRAALHRPPRGRRRATTSCWRSTGARRPPSRSTPRPPADPRGVARAAPARHRGPRGARLRRRAARRRATSDHLTDAIVEDITRQRVGEMRQIISTITPEQYGLIARGAEGALVVQGGPGTGQDRGRPAPRRVAALRRPAARARGRAGRRARTGRSSPTSRRCCRRSASRASSSAPIDALVSRPAARRRPRSEERATLLGQRPDGGRCSSGCCGAGSGRPSRGGARSTVGRVRASRSTPDDVARAHRRRARERAAPTRRAASASATRLADRLADARCSSGSRGAALAGRATVLAPCARRKEYQQLGDQAAGRGRRPERSSARCSRTAAADGGRRATCSRDEEIALLLAVDPPRQARATMTHSDVRAARRGARADRPGAAHVRPRRRRRGAEPHADGAADGRPPRAPAVADRCSATSRSAPPRRGCRTWDAVLREAGVERARRSSELLSLLPRARRLPAHRRRRCAPGAARARAACGEAPWPAVRGRTTDDRARRGRRGAAPRGWPATSAASASSSRRRCTTRSRAALGGVASTPTPTAASRAGRQPARPARVKGLEFDAASSSSPRRSSASAPTAARGGLYTALTRSTRALAIVHAEPLPPAIAARAGPAPRGRGRRRGRLGGGPALGPLPRRRARPRVDHLSNGA